MIMTTDYDCDFEYYNSSNHNDEHNHDHNHKNNNSKNDQHLLKVTLRC